MFGAGLDLDLLGIEIDDKTLVPGLAVASSRAQPLAGISSSNSCSFYLVHYIQYQYVFHIILKPSPNISYICQHANYNVHLVLRNLIPV